MIDLTEEDKAVLAEADRRWGRPRWVEECFPPQRAFVEDAARMKAALTTRRAGKTEGCARYLLREIRRKRAVTCVYIALTRMRAKELMLPLLRRLDTQHGIGLEVNHSDLVVTMPETDSTIMIRGADDARKIERLRGDKYALVIIDEAASFPVRVMRPLIPEVLLPALADLQGTLCLVGTPGAACLGIFHDVTTEDNTPFSVHRWSVLDNPHLPHAQAEMRLQMDFNHWTADTPGYRREWLGQWVRDEQSMVYRYARERNACDVLPEGVWHYMLGIDYGVTDATAYAGKCSRCRSGLVRIAGISEVCRACAALRCTESCG